MKPVEFYSAIKKISDLKWWMQAIFVCFLSLCASCLSLFLLFNMLSKKLLFILWSVMCVCSLLFKNYLTCFTSKWHFKTVYVNICPFNEWIYHLHFEIQIWWFSTRTLWKMPHQQTTRDCCHLEDLKTDKLSRRLGYWRNVAVKAPHWMQTWDQVTSTLV